jgi:hypothetical protein
MSAPQQDRVRATAHGDLQDPGRPDHPPDSPPAGWALTHDLPPGYRVEAPRPGQRLVYLLLFAVGSLLSLFGGWVSFQAHSPIGAVGQSGQIQAGQAISGTGFLLVVIGLVVACVSIGLRLRGSRPADDQVGRSPGDGDPS